MLGDSESVCSGRKYPKLCLSPALPRRKYSFKLYNIQKLVPEKEDSLRCKIAGSCALPLPRSGHRMVNDGANLYLVGGFNPHIQADQRLNQEARWVAEGAPLFYEVWKFNIAKKIWRRVEFTGYMPIQLASHTAVMLPDKVHILMYGGTGLPFGRSSSNRVNVFNVLTEAWRELKPRNSSPGQKPDKMYGQAVACHDGKFYIVGGTSGHEYSSDVHMFDLETGRWERLSPPAEPDWELRRYRHEIAIQNGEIILVGGGTADRVFSLKYFDVFNLEKRDWGRRNARPDPQYGFPADRRCHSMERYERFLFVNGGYDGRHIFPDIWRLDLQDFSWLRIHERVPRPVYFHASTITDEGRMFIFGGVCDIGPMESNVRTNDLYSMWVTIPKLKRIAWEAVLFYSRTKIMESPTIELLENGIPKEFVEELQPRAVGA